MTADVVGLLEAAYALEESDEAWLRGIALAASTAFGVANEGAYALLYDASDVSDFRVLGLVGSRAFTPAVDHLLLRQLPSIYHASPALTEAVFRRTAHGSSRGLPVHQGIIDAHAWMQAAGLREILGLNGVSPDGRSVHVGILLPPAEESAPVGRDLLARVSSHLAAAHRLRSRLSRAGDETGDAIVGDGGKIEHATGGAKLPEARVALADAAVTIERARGAERRRDPERAVARWRALVEAQWSLVDRFERDGKHYLVAYRNEPFAGQVEELSERERQVTALAALGHANKMIAYELGIAASTVSVLLGRAAKRLGVRTRAELVSAFGGHGKGAQDDGGE